MQPSPNFAKSQPISFCRLLQQWEQLVIVNGVLYRQFVHASNDLSYLQLVVPEEMRTRILKCLHEGVASRHLGQDKTLHRLKKRFYWPGQYNDARTRLLPGLCLPHSLIQITIRNDFHCLPNPDNGGGLGRPFPESEWELLRTLWS